MDNKQVLEALTNQRVKITLGGLTYNARKANLKDFAAINKYRVERMAAEDKANAEIDVALYSLCVLLQPDLKLNPEELAERIPLDAIQDINTALENLGFKLPQEQEKSQAKR